MSPPDLHQDTDAAVVPPRRLVVGAERPLFVEGLRLILAGEPGWEVVGQATSGAALLDLLETRTADVALADLSMCHLGGVPLVKNLRERFPALRILVIASRTEPAYVKTLVELGVWGVLCETASPGELHQALEAIAEGHTFLQGEMVGALVEVLGGPSSHAVDLGVSLSPRQQEVLRLATDGLQNKQIARALGISESTVKVRLRQVYAELGVGGRAEAIAAALRLGLVE